MNSITKIIAFAAIGLLSACIFIREDSNGYVYLSTSSYKGLFSECVIAVKLRNAGNSEVLSATYQVDVTNYDGELVYSGSGSSSNISPGSSDIDRIYMDEECGCYSISAYITSVEEDY